MRRSCEIKRKIVENDPEEKGERALLNLGHTIGHAIERAKGFFPHSRGMRCAGLRGCRVHFLEEGTASHGGVL